jgi:hypothetical protein
MTVPSSQTFESYIQISDEQQLIAPQRDDMSEAIMTDVNDPDSVTMILCHLQFEI